MLYVLKHRGLSQPILLGEDVRAKLNAALRDKENSGPIVIGEYTISRWGVEAVEPQESFLAGDADNLSRFGEERCRWGFKGKRGEHRCSESRCREKARRDSPYVRPETWAKADAEAKVTPGPSEPGHVRKATIVAVTAESFRNGRTVLPTLVRFYREDPEQLAPDIRAICATFDGFAISDIPRRSLADFARQ